MAAPKTKFSNKKIVFYFTTHCFLKQILAYILVPDSSGTDPGTTKQATEDVDYRQDDNVQVQAVPLLILQHRRIIHTKNKKVMNILLFCCRWN